MTAPRGCITPIEPVSVTGGAGGTAAHYGDMQTAAGLIGGVSDDVLGIAAACHAMLVDPDVLASAALDPAGSVRFEAALVDALDGDGGLARTGVRIGASAVRLSAAVVTYRTADDAEARLLDAAEFVGGPVLMVDTLLLAGADVAGRVLAGDTPDDAAQRVITEHPGLVDALAGSAPGTVTALISLSPPTALTFAPGVGLPTTVPRAAALVGSLYPDGSPKVTDLGTDESITGRTPPRQVADLLVDLAQRSVGEKGEIDVRVVEKQTSAGTARRAYIVDIPGTRVWNRPGPSPDVNDVGTNLRAIGNETTTYERGIERALTRAGVSPSDPVMLVGYSQGGIVAANAARAFTRSGRYTVTHVVTAGSPVGQVDVPASVQVLSIENRHDIVPHLDARANPDAVNRVTVTVDRQYGTVVDNHSLGRVYVAAAAGVDQSDDPSIRAYLASARPFFDGDAVTTRRYRVERTL